MAHKPKPASTAITATLAGLLILAAIAITRESILLDRQDGQIAEATAHANSLQAQVDWFNAELRERPMVDVPAAEAVIDEEDQ